MKSYIINQKLIQKLNQEESGWGGEGEMSTIIIS